MLAQVSFSARNKLEKSVRRHGWQADFSVLLPEEEKLKRIEIRSCRQAKDEADKANMFFTNYSINNRMTQQTNILAYYHNTNTLVTF